MRTPESEASSRRATAARATRALRSSIGLALLLGPIILTACSSTSTDSEQIAVTTTRPPVDPGPGPTTFNANIVLEEVADGLDEPIAMTNRPMRNQLWIAERAGRIRMISKDTNWDLSSGKVVRDGYTLTPDPVLDLSSITSSEGERGLLGLAFSSDGRTLYVDHTATNGDIVVASYAVTDPLDFSGAPTTTTTTRPSSRSRTTTTPSETAPPPRSSPSTPGPVPRPRIDPASRIVLLTIDHSDAKNHNGGQLALGPDGYLYIGVGDGGRPSDTGNAADPKSLLGKILRIDPAIPDGALQYSIPPDNPFLLDGGAAEVWAVGLRNPWRFSFDRRNGDLWITDVGHQSREELNRVAADSGSGIDLGWPSRDGDQAVENSIDAASAEASSSNTVDERKLVDPILTYNHDDGSCGVIGGIVYRGAAIPALVGVYVYGDRCTGVLRGLLSRNSVVLDDHPLGAPVDPNTLTGFGQDDQGELYVISSSGTLSVIMGAT
ncbi:MAG: hypothetical protein F2520_00605 [Actinobacteria bacterium]|uniref:Unannotated protein n=1 Tax=freshwater metagenome TaxID=449393 RepID=A0A6J5YF34_9ZZZZ|nr:hypothetical protein [Actinomycetota bacterium]